MNLMADVIQYVLFPGIARNRLGFAQATYEVRAEFGGGAPFEWRVGWPVMRDLMRAKEEETRISSVTLTEDGYTVVGVPVKVLPDSYAEDTIMCIIKAETLAVERPV